jgi:hypothetical protein
VLTALAWVVTELSYLGGPVRAGQETPAL